MKQRQKMLLHPHPRPLRYRPYSKHRRSVICHLDLLGCPANAEDDGVAMIGQSSVSGQSIRSGMVNKKIRNPVTESGSHQRPNQYLLATTDGGKPLPRMGKYIYAFTIIRENTVSSRNQKKKKLSTKALVRIRRVGVGTLYYPTSLLPYLLYHYAVRQIISQGRNCRFTTF